MNVNDTEIAWSILQKKGYQRTVDLIEVPDSSVFIHFYCVMCKSSPLKIVVFTGGRCPSSDMLHKVRYTWKSCSLINDN